MTANEKERIINQYLADQQDGFVSNIDTYTEATYKDKTPAERTAIRAIILNAFKP